MTIPIVSGPYPTFRALEQHESFVEFEGSTITIPVRGRRSPKDSWLEETIKLRAFMRLEVYPPYINNLGTREFQFTIRDWELYGKSPMLNQLFYGDPRGQLVVSDQTGLADYVPAVLTFTVAHSYRLGVDPSAPADVRSFFGPDSGIDIRNLTSHHLRVWSAQDDGFKYSNPNNRIYWQLLSPAALDSARLDFLYEAARGQNKDIRPDRALMIFHKKAPEIPGNGAAFDINNPEDVARYLIGVAPMTPVDTKSMRGPSKVLRATLPSRGFYASLVQLPGNSVASSGYLSREGLDIRLPLAGSFHSDGALEEKAKQVFRDSKANHLSGWIQIVSPARSLGTAEQAPLPGHPPDSADFPARITYAINYDIYINQERFVEDQAGIAIAVGANSIPPRDVKVAFEKPQAGLVADRFLQFSSGCCTGMEEIPMQQFKEGVNFARYWRSIPLTPDVLKIAPGSEFQDYNPAREY